MGWIGCVHCEKLWCDFVARTSSLIAQVQPILYRVPFVTKHCQMHRNTTKCSRTWVWFQWGGSSAFFAKNSDATLWHQFNLFCTEFHVVTKHWQMHPNTTKTHQNMSLGSNGVDRVRSLPKIPMRVRGTNFCFNCTSSAYFASIFMQKWNNPKCTQTLQNAPIHEFSVQWRGSGAFIAINSNAISWHELLH